MGEADVLLEAIGLPPLPEGLPLANVLVALDAGSVVGVVALDVAGRFGLALWAAVSGEHQSDGLSRSLGRSLIARSQELGLRELYAVAGDTSNFFSGLGFAPVPQDAVSSAVRRMRSYRNRCVDSSDIQRLALETRI